MQNVPVGMPMFSALKEHKDPFEKTPAQAGGGRPETGYVKPALGDAPPNGANNNKSDTNELPPQVCILRDTFRGTVTVTKQS